MEAASAPRTHGIRLQKPRRVFAAFADEKLVELVRRGDSVAFEVLYDRHSARLLGFCRHMLGSAQDAEDAVQQAFIAAHADLQRHADRELHFKAWLYTIARNRCVSMLRARREQPDEWVELVTDRLTADVQQREDLLALLADVRKLPDDQREALVLSEVGHLSHADVAAVIGCEVAKVKSLVFQARSALIDRRRARDMSCADIREQIATLRGGALRRSHLRHHLDACPGCSEYREQVRRQRQMLALALPVVPSAALRGDVMGALGLGGGSAAAAGGAGAGGGMAFVAKTGIAKIAIAAAVVGGTAGSAAVIHNGGVPGFTGSSSSSSAQDSGSRASGAASRAGTGGGTQTRDGSNTAGGQPKTGSNRSDSGTEHGYTPTTGESNGAAAREFARTRGNGKHTGVNRTTSTRTGNATKPLRGKKSPVARGRTAPKVQPSPKRTPIVKTQPPKTQSAPKLEAAPKTQPAPNTEAAPKAQPSPPAQPAPQPTAPDTGGNATGLAETLGSQDS